MPAAEKAVDVALEITKQIIAISTAILALTGVFFEKIDGMTACQRTLLAATWGVLVLAVLLGLVEFMISAGALAGKTGLAVVNRPDLKLVAAFQVIVFFVAVLLMLIFAYSRLFSSRVAVQRQATTGVESDLKKVQTSSNFTPRAILIHREILFENNRSTIDPTYFPGLVALARDLAITPDVIYLEGHSDSVGSSEYNLSLSKARAEALRDVFVQGGVRGERIKVIPYGKTSSLGREDTIEGRSRNRRVLVRVEAN
ncbi:MAG TPA: OmpA family protein [Thermoanaerobaculia bacterium]|nr:OmpA family protein [Thermoanaerobaculia bacterium]